MSGTKTTWLVTGAAGFLGSHLCQKLLDLGHDVIGWDNFATGLRDNVRAVQQAYRGESQFTFFEEDVSKANWLPKLSLRSPVECVLHFASPASPPHYQRLGLETLWVNSIGTANAVRLADEHKARVVFASTSEVYGDPAVSPQPESYWGNVNSFGPRSCYDESKRFGEALLYTHNLKHGTKHGMVRIFNTYGPRMNPADGRVVVNLLSQGMRNEPMTVYGNGLQTRSFCYVSDLVDGILAYAKSGATRPINLGNNKEFTILELAEKVRKITNNLQCPIVHQDMPVDDPKQRKPDLTLATQILSWSPKVELEEGLHKTAQWLATQSGVTG